MFGQTVWNFQVQYTTTCAHNLYWLYRYIDYIFQEAHVNTCYKHFYYFIREFELVDKKELEPLVSY